MSSHFLLKLAALLMGVALFVAAIAAWRTDRRDRAQLASELAATKQLLAAADARQHDRDAQLSQTLAALATEKRTIVTPAQIIRELPKTIPLPAPVTLQVESVGASPLSRAEARDGLPSTNVVSTVGAGVAPPAGTPLSAPGGAVIPAQDLKPLYDFALDCKACQAKLAAAQSDLTDERTKTAALTKERDDALKLARGGSTWRRIGRAAKWFIIGAATGAIAAKAAH